jgi:ribosomal protein S18 acetylase RimI-like enzyme
VRYERVEPGDDDHLDDAWEVKESIRRDDGFLRQTWDFFSRSYTQNTCHVYLDGDDVAGFATVRDDGYILFLGVAEGHRDDGLGRSLVERVARDHDTLTCHTREGNEAALGFYEHVGFRSKSLIESYYQDGDAAYYLVRGDEGATSLSDRIASALRGDGD